MKLARSITNSVSLNINLRLNLYQVFAKILIIHIRADGSVINYLIYSH